MIRKLTSFFLVPLFFCSALAQGDAAVLSGNGSVFLNGAQLTTPSMAVTNGDVIQTRDTGAANLSASLALPGRVRAASPRGWGWLPGGGTGGWLTVGS